MPCFVRDISDTGARLRMDCSMSPPDTFLVIIELDGIEVDCEVVANRLDLAVAFVSPPRKVSPKRAQIVAALVQDAKPSLRRKPKPITP
jgi:hypothetical protein